MRAVAAELSGYAGKFRCFFGEKNLKTVCFDSLILNQAQHHILADSSLVHCQAAKGYGAELSNPQ